MTTTVTVTLTLTMIGTVNVKGYSLFVMLFLDGHIMYCISDNVLLVVGTFVCAYCAHSLSTDTHSPYVL